jgi:hypothetical protein
LKAGIAAKCLDVASSTENALVQVVREFLAVEAA